MNSAVQISRTLHPFTKKSKRKHPGRTPLKVLCVGNTPHDVKPPSYLEFAEVVNGRCAMQGFVWGAVREATTHQSIVDQLFVHHDNHVNINTDGLLHYAGVVALVTLGTAITSFSNTNANSNNRFIQVFTSDAELINGRSAMLGFVILFALSFFQ